MGHILTKETNPTHGLRKRRPAIGREVIGREVEGGASGPAAEVAERMVGGGEAGERSETDRAIERSHHRHFHVVFGVQRCNRA